MQALLPEDADSSNDATPEQREDLSYKTLFALKSLVGKQIVMVYAFKNAGVCAERPTGRHAGVSCDDALLCAMSAMPDSTH